MGACLASVASEEKAISLYAVLRAICAKNGFRLTKLVSNNRSLLASVPEEEKAKEDRDILPIKRTLGVQWCVRSDAFKFCIFNPDQPLTGPLFLKLPEEDWPVSPDHLQKLPLKDPEVKEAAAIMIP